VPGRVFVAIDPPDRTRELLTSCLDAFMEAAPRWRVEKPVGHHLLHVTLAFLGDVPDPALPALLGDLAAALAGAGPVELTVSGVRAVPSAGRATMLWATMEGAGAAGLERLVRAGAGLPEPQRPFAPHITLARSRRPLRAPAHALDAARGALSDPGKTADRMVSVRSATVYSSTLGSSGPVYRQLGLLTFGGPAG